MNTPPPPSEINPYQISQDASHLNTLSICHYINAGLSLLGLLFIIGYAVLMGAIINSPEVQTELEAEGMPFNPLNFFMIMLLIGGILSILVIVLNFMAARGLSNRKHKTLIQVTAGINCLNIPLGTILGVFTFIVLGRPSVQALFDENTTN